MFLFLLFFVVSLFLFNTFLIAGILIREKTDGKRIDSAFTNFSVLIAAKNEEKNLGALLRSIEKLNYPAEHFEIIFIDDNSQDSTLTLLKEFESKRSNVKVISAKGKKIPGKKGALQIGFENANYEIIATTDADCILSPEWLNELNKKFLENYDLVIGNVVLKPLKNFSQEYSAFEHFRNRLIIFSFAKLGMPYSAGGGNFAFRKKILEEIGGYRNISKVLSGDDDLLLQKAKSSGYKIGTLLTKNSFVITHPPFSFSELLKQRIRHVSTSNYYSLTSKLLLGFWHGLNVLSFWSVILTFHKITFLILPFVKLLADFTIVSLLQSKFAYKFKPLKIFIFQILYELLVPVYYLKGTFGKVKWK